MAEKQTDPITKIDSKLGEYEEALTGELLELKESEREVKAKLRQIKAMRRAGGSGSTEAERPSLPAPKKAEVIEIAASILEDGPLSEDDLKEKVASQLRRTHTLSGLSLRMSEALRTDRFEVDSSGLVRLTPKKARSEGERQS